MCMIILPFGIMVLEADSLTLLHKLAFPKNLLSAMYIPLLFVSLSHTIWSEVQDLELAGVQYFEPVAVVVFC